MAESYLDKYRDEIMTLYREHRYTQARIRQHLEEKYEIDVPKSTLSVFVKRLPPPDARTQPAAELPPEADNFLAQYESIQTLMAGYREVVGAVAQVHGRMGVLEDEAQRRYDSLLSALKQGTAAGQAESLSAVQGMLKQQADDLAVLKSRVTSGGVKRPASWPKAVLISGAAWGTFFLFLKLWWG